MFGNKKGQSNAEVLGMAIGVILVIALILAGPFIFIWAINTLFGLTIAYTFKTWLAALVISATLAARNVNTKKD